HESVFEKKKGLPKIIGKEFDIPWEKMSFEHILRTSIKKYNSEVHSQTVVDGVLELRAKEQIDPEEVESIHCEVFHQANTIIGEGEQAGDKKYVYTKEQAGHSLPYITAV